MESLGQNGVLQVIPPAALEQQLQQQATAQAAASMPAQPATPELAGFIKGQFEIFRNHRNTQSGWSERLLAAMRAFNGQYDATKLNDIKRFGGSEIYARLTAQKCRAASSLLRDVYLGADRPWALKPPEDPDVPPEIMQKIDMLMQAEQQMVGETMGKPPSPTDVQNRKDALLEAAREQAKKKAMKQAKIAEDKIEELLREGSFYHAMAEFLVDLPIFPFACIKGPIVRIIPEVVWPPGGGLPTVKQTPKLIWQRISPFDLWWTPGVADIRNANVIEKIRYTRAELNDLLDLPGYNVDEIRAVLDEYGRGGLYDGWDSTDSERAVLESRENPMWNRSQLITAFEFHGNVQGRILQEYGLAVPDELRDYHIQAWQIGMHVIKAQLSPSPRQRHPYFITSFEKVPGTPVGNGLTDLVADLQEATNATLRSLVNNLAIASGPQVVINDDRLTPEENGEELYPWKRWHTRSDPVGQNSRPPIEFFQPQAITQQLLEAYKEFVNIADDVSAIPKYIGGQGGSGAGRTASGLAMLMGNASKILQSVSANIDRDVWEDALLQLFDLILLTDTSGMLTGEEQVSVLGVNVAVQRETQRQRQIEFLSATANPLDQKIVGLKGRGVILRSVSNTIGMDGENIVPSDDVLDKMMEAEKKQQESGPTAQVVKKGVMEGVEAGVQAVTKELVAAGIGARAQVPGMSPGPGGPAAPGSAGHGGPGGPPPGGGGSSANAARQAQGARPSRLSNSMGPQTDVVGNQRGKGAMPVRGGVG
jgi:hypothetical protein